MVYCLYIVQRTYTMNKECNNNYNVKTFIADSQSIYNHKTDKNIV